MSERIRLSVVSPRKRCGRGLADPARIALRWAEGAQKRHARNSDGDAAIEVLSVSSVFWADRSVLVRLG